MLENFTILIVDDESEIRDLFTEELTDRGATVIQAKSGHNAIDILADTYVDIVLTDVQMADGDGVELIRAIKLLPYSPGYIFVLTGGSAHDEKHLLSLGVKEVFYKPINWKHVTERITALCKSIVKTTKPI